MTNELETLLRAALERSKRLVGQAERGLAVAIDEPRFHSTIELPLENAKATCLEMLEYCDRGQLNESHVTALNMDLDELSNAIMFATANIGART